MQTRGKDQSRPHRRNARILIIKKIDNKEVLTIEELYFGSVHFSDFSVLSGMTKLKKVEHTGYMPKESIEKIRSEGLDFSFCPDLELFVLDPLKERFDFIPDIKVSSKKVWLRMYNQPITRDKLSKREQEILKSFFLKVTLFLENTASDRGNQFLAKTCRKS